MKCTLFAVYFFVCFTKQHMKREVPDGFPFMGFRLIKLVGRKSSGNRITVRPVKKEP